MCAEALAVDKGVVKCSYVEPALPSGAAPVCAPAFSGATVFKFTQAGKLARPRVASGTRYILTTLLSLSICKYLEAPMVAMYHAQRAALAAGRSLPQAAWLSRAINYLNPFVASLGDYMNIAVTLRLPPGHVITPNDATMAASVYARMVCEKVARDELNSLVLNNKVTKPATLFSHVTSAGPPKQVHYDLVFGLQHYAAGASFPSKCTPLSCIIEMGGGCITARVTIQLPAPNLLAIRSARLGACSLHYAPLAPPSWVTKGERSEDHFRAIAKGTLCPLCTTATADPRHILCDCTHPAVAAARTTARNNWTGDAAFASESECYDFNTGAFFKHYLAMVLDAQAPNGEIGGGVPDQGTAPTTIHHYQETPMDPSWSAVLPVVAFNLWKYYNCSVCIDRGWAGLTLYYEMLHRNYSVSPNVFKGLAMTP
jgi:hypothetical protein